MKLAGLTVVSVIVRVIIVLAALFFGEWIAAAAGWGAFLGTGNLFWRLLGAILAAMAVIFIIDRLWKNRPAPNSRFFVSEIVDAFILGFFFGVAFAV